MLAAARENPAQRADIAEIPANGDRNMLVARQQDEPSEEYVRSDADMTNRRRRAH